MPNETAKIGVECVDGNEHPAKSIQPVAPFVVWGVTAGKLDLPEKCGSLKDYFNC